MLRNAEHMDFNKLQLTIPSKVFLNWDKNMEIWNRLQVFILRDVGRWTATTD